MTQTPDVVYAEQMAGVERRMGLDPIHELLAKRQEFVEQVADLRAQYGSFGTFDPMRKSTLSTIKMQIRAEAVAGGVKKTEACLDEEAHADARYVEFITSATQGRADLAVLEAKIEHIDATIYRANVIARYLSAEAAL